MRNFIAVVLSLIFSIGSCEVFLRLTNISYPIFSRVDKDLGVALRPEAEGWWRTEGESYVRINTQGLRDREHSISKPPNVLRVAVLGDSFAEAVQVPAGDTFWAVLEREMRHCQFLGGRNPEVINFGVSGYGTAQELIMLRRRVWNYAPDVVLLVVTPTNDVRNNSRALERDSRRPYFVYQGDRLVEDGSFRELIGFRVRATLLVQSITSIRDSSRLFQLVNEAVRRTKQFFIQVPDAKSTVRVANSHQDQKDLRRLDGEAGLDIAAFAEPENSDWDEAWRVTEGLITEMYEDVNERRKLFLVATVSSGPQVGPDPESRHAFEQRLGVQDLFYAESRIRSSSHNRFPVVALAPIFQRYAEENGVFLHGFVNSGMGRGHWNAAGHRLAGKVLTQEICQVLNDSDLSKSESQTALARDRD